MQYQNEKFQKEERTDAEHITLFTNLYCLYAPSADRKSNHTINAPTAVTMDSWKRNPQQAAKTKSSLRRPTGNPHPNPPQRSHQKPPNQSKPQRMKRKGDPRHQSRIIALQKLFSMHFNEECTAIQPPDTSDIAETNGIEKYDKKMMLDIITGVEKNIEELDRKIELYAPQWPIAQIQKVDLEILRIALWEGFLSKMTPPKVAIDEAIEIAKEFGGDSSGRFVNGVLGAIYEKDKKDA